MSGKDYARLVSRKYRSARSTPRINRPIRPRVIAWAGPAAFYPNRFYEIDRWYKARIDKPEKQPQLRLIEPSDYNRSVDSLIKKDLDAQINIGFAEKDARRVAGKSDAEKAALERKARRLELLIDVDKVEKQDLEIYHHYKIFEHLFGEDTYFHNVQDLNVAFGDAEMYNGNIIVAQSMSHEPKVEIENIATGSFSTILLVNLDGNVFEGLEGEVVQWMVKDIPDGKLVKEGVEVLPYLRPLPFMGTGYHRLAAVLFRHKKPLDFDFQLDKSLGGRVMKIAEFYKACEEQLTPSAIRFCQTSYDLSCKEALHGLGLKSPIYEYEFTESLKPAQREFPVKAMPFDLYLDMYRDPKEMEEEILEERLRRAQIKDYRASKWIDPDYNENKKTLPAWLHARLLERKGRYAGIYDNAIKN